LKGLFSIMLLIIISTKTHSQLAIDSLWRVFNDDAQSDSVRLGAIDKIAWDGYLYKLPDSSIYYAKIQHDFAKKTGNKHHLAMSLNTMGAAYDMLGSLRKALDYYEKALKIRREMGDKQGIASSLNNIGTVYRNLGRYSEAISYFLESYKIKEQIGDHKGCANSLLGIGNIFKEQGEYDNSLNYYNKSLEIRKKLNDKKGEATSILAIGNIYWIKKDYETALKYYFKSMEIQEELQDDYGVSNSLNNIAVILQDQNKLDQALSFHLKSLSIREKIGDKLGISSSLSNIGVIYYKKGNLRKAITFGEKALLVAKSSGAIKYIRDAYGALYETYKALGNYKKSLELYERYVKLTDSISSEENHRAITRLELEFEFSKKSAADSIKNIEREKLNHAQLKAQKAQNDKQSIELNAKSTIQQFLFGGLTLVLLFSGFLYNRYRVTQRQRDVIEKQKKEVELQRESAEIHRTLVEQKNKEILDSIAYAKRIQEAVLPSRHSLNESLNNGFVLFKPKDVVSGDFYWLEKTSDTIYFAAADCTGHGVPGALVSVVCSNSLSKALLEDGITETGKLLDRTRELVVERFKKSGDEVKDGMDISLAALSLSQNSTFKNQNPAKSSYTTAMWSGANNPIWVFNTHRSQWPEEAEILKNEEGVPIGFSLQPNNQPIGLYDRMEPFTTYYFDIEKGDTLYLFTDGYMDQFGGPKGKKLKASKFKELLMTIQDMPMDDQRDFLNDEIEKWKGSLEQVDDICIIGVRPYAD
jgi:tetratricopeptide (TPR) repeat protein